MPAFDLPGALRRIRRLADVSQRALAQECGLSQSAVAQAESGRRDLPVAALARAAAVAGLRVVLVAEDGTEVPGMTGYAVRDSAGKRFPAHLDTHHSDERWWRYEHRPDRPRPWFTIDRDRAGRDALRRRYGTPGDHRLPGPCDSPAERAAARRRENQRVRAEERERAFLAGEFAGLDDGFTCSCPPECDELDDRSGKPVHAPGCPCDCDVS